MAFIRLLYVWELSVPLSAQCLTFNIFSLCFQRALCTFCLCVIFWGDILLFAHLLKCHHRFEFVCISFTVQGTMTVSAHCRPLAKDWGFSFKIFVCLFFTVSYMYTMFSGSLSSPPVSPVLSSLQISFSYLLILVLFIVPRNLTRPVYVIFNLEQAIRA